MFSLVCWVFFLIFFIRFISFQSRKEQTGITVTIIHSLKKKKKDC